MKDKKIEFATRTFDYMRSMIMNREELYRLIRDEVRKSFEIENDNIDINDNLMEFGLDSINMVMMILEIESIFNIEIPDEDLVFENFDTIKKISDYVLRIMD